MRMGEVSLRAKTEDDEDLLFRLAGDLDTWEERGPASPAPLTLAAYRSNVAQRSPDDNVEFIIEVAGRAVGRCSLFSEDRLARHAEVGIALLPDERGRGYGTQALRLLVEFAFVRRNLRRLYLWVISSNTAAIASYLKVGFVEEGRHREHAWVRGQYEDEVAMGLLRSEWRR